MTLQERIKKDLTLAIKNKDEEKKEAVRVILGELARGEQKVLSDDQVIKILGKLKKSEQEVMEKTGAKEDSAFLKIVDGYLPKMATEEEIRAWIKENVDFSAFKDKMQAMRPIMQHFVGRADGNAVRRILQGNG